MKNRLRLLRKAMGKTQADIAKVVGITQNAYSYWERGFVKIHTESLLRLADFYEVSVDFIIGKPFTVSIPPERWNENLKKQYDEADDDTRVYMEYRYGNEESTRDAIKDSSEENSISPNTILYHRDGKLQKRELSPAQMKILLAMFDMENEAKNEQN